MKDEISIWISAKERCTYAYSQIQRKYKGTLLTSLLGGNPNRGLIFHRTVLSGREHVWLRRLICIIERSPYIIHRSSLHQRTEAILAPLECILLQVKQLCHILTTLKYICKVSNIIFSHLDRNYLHNIDGSRCISAYFMILEYRKALLSVRG